MSVNLKTVTCVLNSKILAKKIKKLSSLSENRDSDPRGDSTYFIDGYFRESR